MGAARELEEAGVQAAFFIMPVQILKSLHDEFRGLAGADAARAILFRIGFSSGEAVTRKIEQCADIPALRQAITEGEPVFASMSSRTKAAAFAARALDLLE